MRRFVGVIFGIATQLLFLFTVWHLFWFLKGDFSHHESGALAIDVLLALQFAVGHSLLLYPGVRSAITRKLPAQFYGSLFCIQTCVGILLTAFFWRSSPIEIWNLTSWSGWIMSAGFYGSWISLLYSLNLTGLGYQTGLTQWWYWLRRKPLPRREFQPRSLYCCMRHPVYLSFMGLLWFTPLMTLDHAILTGIWTAYIFVGSYLKDERLSYYIGKPYRDYQARVPGYPFIFFGPLGKRKTKPAPVKPLKKSPLRTT
ncbi:NnrU family protein [Gimesia panareensis]|uniref:NnrU family protein n=1 Tax=Gimesia panareensis TaxID=2527978 RepID=UPI00118D470E|nr:NnrU family protein [Gimesia panareensis]QDU49259.1 NnrU protein [Gimesia panareensis]